MRGPASRDIAPRSQESVKRQGYWIERIVILTSYIAKPENLRPQMGVVGEPPTRRGRIRKIEAGKGGMCGRVAAFLCGYTPHGAAGRHSTDILSNI